MDNESLTVLAIISMVLQTSIISHMNALRSPMCCENSQSVSKNFSLYCEIILSTMERIADGC